MPETNRYKIPYPSDSDDADVPDDLEKMALKIEEELKKIEEAGESGGTGENGATFTPNVSNDGVISWTNDKGLENPSPVNIKGPQGPKGDTGSPGNQGEQGPQGIQGEIGPANILTIGTVESGDTPNVTITGDSPNQTLNFVLPKGDKGEKGDTGSQGPQGPKGEDGAPGENGQDGKDGENGATFMPNVLNDGTITWTNDKGLENPHTVNIKGPQGPKGDKGDKGDTGQNGATPIKGIDYFTEEDIEGLGIPKKTSDIQNDSGFVASTQIKKIAVVDELPETEEDDVLYLVKQSETEQTNNYVTDSLGLYINANNGIEDLSGNEVSLINGGNLQFENKTISFNGTNQYIAAEYVPTDTVNFTIEFYGTLKNKLNGDVPQDSHSVLSFGTQSPNKLSLQIMEDLAGIAVWGNTAGTDNLATSIQEDSLTHIVFRITNGVLDCFVNGVKYANLITGWQPITNFSEVVIGAKYNKIEQFLYGTLKQFRIYNKPLTDDEIQQNYAFCLN